nr:MAG TPA: hypothetical protein [Caudoviricetes sp.]
MQCINLLKSINKCTAMHKLINSFFSESFL